MGRKGKTGAKAAAQGAEAFRAHYQALYGERWPSLERALAAEPDSLAFRVAPEAVAAGGPGPAAGAAAAAAGVAAAAASAAAAAGTEPYYLDSASIQAAETLELPATGEILDACAAPGGKTLVLASRLPPGARLIANELSSDRRRRLAAVLDRHLPPELRLRVAVSGEDAAAMCRRNLGRFGAILLDAPCSSERHVLADPLALAAWSPSRPKSLAQRQWALLSSAFLMLAPGGCLVYSTCSLEPAENDGVLARLLAKHGASLELCPPLVPCAEPTRFGLLILPDVSSGAGPMYIARLKKRG